MTSFRKRSNETQKQANKKNKQISFFLTFLPNPNPNPLCIQWWIQMVF